MSFLVIGMYFGTTNESLMVYLYAYGRRLNWLSFKNMGPGSSKVHQLYPGLAKILWTTFRSCCKEKLEFSFYRFRVFAKWFYVEKLELDFSTKINETKTTDVTTNPGLTLIIL